MFQQLWSRIHGCGDKLIPWYGLACDVFGSSENHSGVSQETEAERKITTDATTSANDAKTTSN